MKYLFKCGNIYNNDNMMGVSLDNIDEEEFKETYTWILDYIDGYDVIKIDNDDNLDAYCLYYFKTPRQDIDDLLDILTSNTVDSLSKANLPVLTNIGYNTYLDLENNIIIVLGKDNLKTLLYLIERARWRNVDFSQMKKENVDIYINASASRVYKKVMNIN